MTLAHEYLATSTRPPKCFARFLHWLKHFAWFFIFIFHGLHDFAWFEWPFYVKFSPLRTAFDKLFFLLI